MFFHSIDKVILQLEPLDVGAEKGLTFTAPHWLSSSPEPVSRHGSRNPKHVAAGFYYPHLKELPAIAQVEFTKVCINKILRFMILIVYSFLIPVGI